MTERRGIDGMNTAARSTGRAGAENGGVDLSDQEAPRTWFYRILKEKGVAGRSIL